MIGEGRAADEGRMKTKVGKRPGDGREKKSKKLVPPTRAARRHDLRSTVTKIIIFP